MRITTILALAAATAAAQSAHAQGLVGVGATFSAIGEQRVHTSDVGAGLHLRAGWSLTPNATLMLEGTLNGLDSSRPDSTLAFQPGPDDGPYYERFTRTLKTQWLLASVQLGREGSLYVRPGFGFARHAYLAPSSISFDFMTEATKWETTPALGLAVGRQVPIRGFPLNVEVAAGWSGGEHSTNSRWTAGLQVVRVIRF